MPISRSQWAFALGARTGVFNTRRPKPFNSESRLAEDIREKPRIKCADCQYRRFLPVTDEVIRWHLSGCDESGQPLVVGVCRRDRRKDRLLQENGYLVLRFLAEDVSKDLDSLLDAILRALANRRRIFP